MATEHGTPITYSSLAFTVTTVASDVADYWMWIRIMLLPYMQQPWTNMAQCRGLWPLWKPIQLKLAVKKGFSDH